MKKIETSCYSSGSDNPHRRRRTYQSVVVSRGRIYAYGSLRPRKSGSQRHLDPLSRFAVFTIVTNVQTHRPRNVKTYVEIPCVRRANTRSSAIAEGPRDAPCQLKPC